MRKQAECGARDESHGEKKIRRVKRRHLSHSGSMSRKYNSRAQKGHKNMISTYLVNLGYYFLDPCVPDLKPLWRILC